MNILKIFITIYLISLNISHSRTRVEILKSTENSLTIKISRSVKTIADVYPDYVYIGLPSSDQPDIKTISFKESTCLFQTEKISKKLFELSNIQKHQNLTVATLKINPVINENKFLNEINLQIIFKVYENNFRKAFLNEKTILSKKIINWDQSKNWFIPNKPGPRAKTSLIPSGKWISFNINDDGIKQISYNKLKEVFNEIDNQDPRSIMLYSPSNFGRASSYQINIPIPENLIELPIIIEGETDGVFNPNDKIIFYGQGPSGFDLKDSSPEWSQNLYFSTSKYWILLPDNNELRGERISTSNEPDIIDITLDYGISYYHDEIDLINPEQSGLRWFGSNINSGSTQILSTNTPNAKSEVDCYAELKLKGNSLNGSSSTYHSIELYANSSNQNKIGGTSSWTGNGFRTISGIILGENLNPVENNFFINNISPDGNSSPLIDYLHVRYGRKLIFDQNNFDFFSPIQDANIRFNFLSELPQTASAFDISNPKSPKNISIKSNSILEVQGHSETIGRYIIFDKNEIDSVINITFYEQNKFSTLRNNNIRADYIIIGPKEFYEAARPLLELRSPAIYANLEDIYREFSGGNNDPIAIRTFIQWTQENWISPAPIHLLLLGDTGYDFRNINGLSAVIVPTIQVQSYISYPSDDRLATIYGNIPEISIGRFPAKNIMQVENFVEKIEFIESNKNYGTWRQKVTLIADDPARPEPNHGGIATGKSHTLNSETLSEIIPSKIDIEKIYMLEYPEVSDASAYGVTKPDATQALFNSIRSGTAIINYIGHGSAFQLAQEKLLDLNRGDLENIKSNNQLPLWIVGTCSFGHFDDPIAESFGEELIRYPMDAASAVISTCRPITVTGNERYTQEIFESFFENDQVTNEAIGICLQSIKNGSTESEYFHLFGDPALKLPMVYKHFSNAALNTDTLKTLSIGEININQNFILGDGKGVIILKDADRPVTRTYNIASSNQTLSYKLPGPTLFRGNFNFSGNEHSIQIRIPQDISYSESSSKILIYIYDDEQEVSSEINPVYIVGGDATMDQNGPIIEFKSKSGRSYRNGDHKNLNEELIVQISDPLGINLTKELGHSIILKDITSDNSFDITDSFVYNNNSITTGEILISNYISNDIDIIVSAWDNANNPSEKKIKLFSTEINKLKIFNVYNFPNPFYDKTKFTFEMNKEAEISIFIYTLGGKKIRQIKNKTYRPGFHSIEWNGKNEFGRIIANGVYVYKIIAKNFNDRTHHIGKIAFFK